MKLKSGFSLLELVLAVAIFSFSSFALATMIIDSNISTRLSADRTDALLYAKEGVEAVRSIRDNDWTSWASTTEGNHGLSINTVGSSSAWVFSGTSDLIDNKYTRTVNIATDSEVPTSKDVAVNIAWDLTPGRIASTTLLTIFSNWPDVINSSLAVPRGLVSYWSFDDAGAGTAGDSIGGNDGTVTGATATTSVKGIANQAYSFSGSGDYIDAGANTITDSSPFSLCAWIKTTTVGKYSGAISIGSSVSGQSAYIGTVAGAQAGGSNSIGGGLYGSNFGTGITTLNAWNYIVMTFSGGTNGVLNIYVNNQLMMTQTVTPILSGSSTKIGRIGTDTAYDFSGVIDNVRIYRRALTADEVTTIYNSEKP
jgi:prepilin-type N-terminal cleavage/methylation domain-containing protein